MNITKAAQILGRKTSPRKAESSRKNGKDIRPHFKKVAHFELIFPYALIDNEWKKKFPVGKTPKGRIATYNPDYWCPSLMSYIEVATSKPNISEQGWKWKKAIKSGVNLRVFWWEGNELKF